MTTVIAVETKNGVIFGSDSQMTSYGKRPMSEGKIVKNGPYTFATSGRARLIQDLKYVEFPVPSKDEDLTRFMATTFVYYLTAVMKAANLELGHNQIIASIYGKVFFFNADLHLVESNNGVHIIGSGTPWADAALDGKTRIGEAEVRRALEAAAERDPFTSGPFFVTTIRN